MPFVGKTHVGPRNLVLDVGPDPPTRRDTWKEEMCRSIIIYQCITAFSIVHLPLKERQDGDSAFCQITLHTCYYSAQKVIINYSSSIPQTAEGQDD